MGYAELNGKYHRLRNELEVAYAAPVWDRRRIDQIADELTETELALASPAHIRRAAQPAMAFEMARGAADFQ